MIVKATQLVLTRLDIGSYNTVQMICHLHSHHADPRINLLGV
jgi:hypothetical protein